MIGDWAVRTLHNIRLADGEELMLFVLVRLADGGCVCSAGYAYYDHFRTSGISTEAFLPMERRRHLTQTTLNSKTVLIVRTLHVFLGVPHIFCILSFYLV